MQSPIAWAIAQGLHAAGANMAITYQNARLEQEGERPDPLAARRQELLDVSNDEEIARLFEKLKARYAMHVLIHSVAYAPAEELKVDFAQTTRGRFPHCPRCKRLFADRGRPRRRPTHGRWRQHHHHDLLRRRKSSPRYNVMGVAKAALECTVRYLARDLGNKKIRVNAISAGPI